MVTRVTQLMSQNTLLSNINNIKGSLLTIQDQLASGKRVNKASDDPLSIGSIMTLQSTISINTQFIRNIDYTRNYLDKSEAILGNASSLVTRAKELAIQQSNTATYDARSRRVVATEIRQLANEAISLGNTTLGSRYLFGGTVTDLPPVASGGLFYGNSKAITTQVDQASSLQVNTSASKVFVSDLNPALSNSATTASLNKGTGLAALGSINITNRLGTTTAVNLAGQTTIGGIIAAINAAGAGVTASINTNKDGITITDNSAGTPTSNLIIADGDGTFSASQLKITGNRSASSITGGDLDPAAISTTLLSDLNGGSGLSLGSINIQNGGVETTLNVGAIASAAATLGGLTAAISATASNVTATINRTGTGIDVNSNSATTVATVNEVNSNGTTAAALGIQGGNNLVKTLETLARALEANDSNAISNSISLLNTVQNSISEARSIIGGRTNRIEMKQEILQNTNVNDETNLTYIRDTDMTQAAITFNQLQVSQNAALATASKILNTSLVDFLR